MKILALGFWFVVLVLALYQVQDIIVAIRTCSL